MRSRNNRRSFRSKPLLDGWRLAIYYNVQHTPLCRCNHMIIVFGWVKKGKRERPLLDTYCYRCKRQTTWDWFRLTDWLSVFFIALVPVKDEHLLACQGCGDQLALTKNDVRGIKQLKTLAPRESQQLHDALVQRLEEHQLAGKSETQREFLKSKRRD